VSRPASKILVRLKQGISMAGLLTFLAGIDWIWKLRDVWPRAAGDPVPQSLLEAIGVIIAGLFLVSKSQ
jgi:hypothetical protein